MRYLILSDIHSNLAALDAVLLDAGSFDEIWCMGDLVGYGPEPNECIQRIREFPHTCVAGNHDWGALGKLDIDDFNDRARRACLWTRSELNQSSWEYLDALEERQVRGDFTIVHGSPRHAIWEYLFRPDVADESFVHFDTSFCLVGHTHVPVLFTKTHPSRPTIVGELPRAGIALDLAGGRLIINPGGVGQPRDGDHRAAFAILDSETMVLEHRRVAYPVEVTQHKMEKAGLPDSLIRRLSHGL